MLRRVALVRTDVSQEPSASFIRVTRIRELGTTLAATSNRRRLLFCSKFVILTFASSSVVVLKWLSSIDLYDRLSGLVVRIPGYKSRGSAFDCHLYHIFWEAAGLERGPLSLGRITEELLTWRSSGSGLENGDKWPLGPVALTTRHSFTCKSWHWLRRPKAAAQSLYFACGLKATYFFVLFVYAYIQVSWADNLGCRVWPVCIRAIRPVFSRFALFESRNNIGTGFVLGKFHIACTNRIG
jgi:hypothetical protein